MRSTTPLMGTSVHPVTTPTADQVEGLRRAVRYILSTERVSEKARQLNLTQDQKSQLRERTNTEAGAAEAALFRLYAGRCLRTCVGYGIVPHPSRLLRCTAGFRNGSWADDATCPQRRQLSSKAVIADR
jgi:hypothetical protein